MPWPAMDNLHDVPRPDAGDTVPDGSWVTLQTTELDRLLHQVESLSHQYPDTTAEALQATLLAKRLSPIKDLITPLCTRAAHYQHTIRADNLPEYLQTDLIAPLLSALEPHLKNYTDPECFVLSLERCSEHIQAQFYVDTCAVGEPVMLAYRYALDEALLVEHQSQVYAISPQQLVQVVRLPATELQDPVTHAGAEYRVRELHTLFAPEQTAAPLPDTVRLLLTRTQDALRVDQILGYHRRLIRPVSLPGRPLSWLSGGSLLPDGRIAWHIELHHLVGDD